MKDWMFIPNCFEKAKRSGKKYLIIPIMHKPTLQRNKSMAFDMPVISCIGLRAITCER